MYRCYLFDWDGTLVNTLPLWLEGYQKAFHYFNLAPTREEISAKAFGDWQGCVKFGIQDVDRFNQLLTDHVYQHFCYAPLSLDVKNILDDLKNPDFKVGLVTSSQREVISQALSYHHLKDYFQVIVAKEDVIKHKPDPESLFKAMKHLSANLAQTIMIGDSKSDIMAAHNAGIASCLYCPASYEAIYSYDYTKDYAPTYKISEFMQLLEII